MARIVIVDWASPFSKLFFFLLFTSAMDGVVGGWTIDWIHGPFYTNAHKHASCLLIFMAEVLFFLV